VVDLNRNNIQVLQRQFEATQDRFEVGEITRTDVAQAEARLSRSVSDRVQSEGNLISSRAAYARLVGSMPGTLEPAPRLRDLPKSESNAIDIAMDNNPLLAAARSDEEASRHAIDVSRGRLLPTVYLNGDISHREEISVSVDEANEYGFAARVTIPLYQSGSAYSEIRQNREINSQRIVQVEEARREVVEGVTQAWESLNTARAEIQSRRDQVRAAEIALEGVRQESIVGARTTLDVLDAEQELLDARVALVVAERDEFVASFELAAAIGGLTAANLELPVELYDVEAHYREVRDLPWVLDVPWQ
jgi:TolC family type I secretion outer membrane protein